jgi:tRNA 2-thiocytidine biosynthesis protein TtcA
MLLLFTADNRTTPKPHELLGLHVTLDADGESEELPPMVRAWCQQQGVAIDELAPRLDPSETRPSGCFRCAQVRRRTLLEAAEQRGCRWLALGHHADDVVDTWLVSLLYSGTPQALPPKRSYFGGAVTLVRPLYELRKQELARLAQLFEIPVAAGSCQREDRSSRERVCAALSALGKDQRLVRRNIYWHAVRQYERETGLKQVEKMRSETG